MGRFHGLPRAAAAFCSGLRRRLRTAGDSVFSSAFAFQRAPRGSSGAAGRRVRRAPLCSAWAIALIALAGAGTAFGMRARAGSPATPAPTTTTSSAPTMPSGQPSSSGAASAVVVAGGVALGPVNGIFYPNPSGGGPFDFSQLSHPAFSQRFQFLYFNPFPQHFQLACSNDPGVTTDTRPFTDVIQNPDGTCSTVKAQGNGQQAGLGSLFNFEATFTTEMTVASAGQLTFALYVDDGWIFGAGPRIGGTEQPTYVSGLLQNPPPSSPLKGYPVVGAWNTTSHGGNVSLTVNFPAAGTYPIEFDYTECCGGGNSLLLMTSNFGPIGPNLNPVQQTFGSCSGVGSQALSPSGCMNEPVNTLTGAYTTAVVDARLAGIGVPLAFTRSYTSADTTQGRFGIGWT